MIWVNVWICWYMDLLIIQPQENKARQSRDNISWYAQPCVVTTTVVTHVKVNPLIFYLLWPERPMYITLDLLVILHKGEWWRQRGLTHHRYRMTTWVSYVFIDFYICLTQHKQFHKNITVDLTGYFCLQFGQTYSNTMFVKKNVAMINLESIATWWAGRGRDKMVASLWRVFVWMKTFEFQVKFY